jgi:hypothetical protein
MSEFAGFCRQKVRHYYLARHQFPLEECVIKGGLWDGVLFSQRTGAVREARLFIRLCRIEEEHWSNRRREFTRDRPYWRYFVFY